MTRRHEALTILARAQRRAQMGRTLQGRHAAWDRLALRHNSVARPRPCRFCGSGVAGSVVGPAIFHGADPVCAACASEIAPELATYCRTLQVMLAKLGGDWRELAKRVA